jgi:hypothetical protein
VNASREALEAGRFGFLHSASPSLFSVHKDPSGNLNATQIPVNAKQLSWGGKRVVSRFWLSLDEAQDIRINYLRMSCHQAVRKARIDFERAMPQQLRLQQ